MVHMNRKIKKLKRTDYIDSVCKLMNLSGGKGKGYFTRKQLIELENKIRLQINTTDNTNGK